MQQQVYFTDYEKEYISAVSEKETSSMRFNDIMDYFERLNLHPTQLEVNFAAKTVLEGTLNYMLIIMIQ